MNHFPQWNTFFSMTTCSGTLIPVVIFAPGRKTCFVALILANRTFALTVIQIEKWWRPSMRKEGETEEESSLCTYYIDDVLSQHHY